MEHTVSRLHATGGPRTNRALAAMVPLYPVPVAVRAARLAIAQPRAGGERHFGRHDEPGQPEPRESKCKKRSMQMPKVL